MIFDAFGLFSLFDNNGDAIGPCAVLDCETRQVRKEAAVMIDAGAAMWLIAHRPIPPVNHRLKMSYLVLARKYRPRTFQALIGQETTVRALMNALEQQRLHHAYLFTGTRGVGKTTVARILAKCLNCEAGISATPCGNCQTCQEIDQNRFIDLLEVDAASRTKVEDTRELLENVQYTPQRGRYKIYLIDEVHMLSGHSFNALLKTLEEPPTHVIFLFATTDPQRLPATVLSRCLQFHLKNMSAENIVLQLATVLAQEHITYEDTALTALATAAQGSMRDALSLLDQSIAYGNGTVTASDVIAMLGTIDQQRIIELLQLLAQLNATELLAKIDELAELGADFLAVLDEILSQLQRIAVAQLLGKTGDQTIAALAKQITSEDIQLYYQIGLIGKRDLPLAPEPKAGFTMTMIRMLAFTPKHLPTSEARKAHQSSNIVQAPAKTDHTTFSHPATKMTTATEDLAMTEDKEIHHARSNSHSRWPVILSKLNLTGVAQLLAANCALAKFTEETIELCLEPTQAALLNAATKERVTKALQAYLGKPININIGIGTTGIETPAQTQTRLTNEQQMAAQQSVINDPQVQALMQKFAAKIQPESITLIGERKSGEQ